MTPDNRVLGKAHSEVKLVEITIDINKLFISFLFLNSLILIFRGKTF